jgi:hypothetical protein
MLDDAAMFPPGNAPADVAIRDHLAHRQSWYRRLVGPLLVHVDRWDEFVAAYEAAGGPVLDVVVIGSCTRPSPVPATVSVVGCELVAPEDLEGLADAAGGLALEAPGLDRLEQVLALVTDLRARGVAAVLKYRTGGMRAESFPPASEVAEVIAAAVRHDVPVKFTAGLHHAVRHRDPQTGFEHHGFLNILWAVVMAQAGVPVARLTEILEEHDRDTVAQVASSWSAADTAAARGTFVSFGCCGVQDPVRDLQALGMLTPPTEEAR